jgi:hypothetical protein
VIPATGDTAADEPAASADGVGDVVGAWTMDPDTDRQGDEVVRLAAYDAAPPKITSFSVLGSLLAGQQGTFGLTATDVWSGIGSVDWSFGATGASATHAYAASGSYTVTADVTDGAGNTATGSGALTVTQVIAATPTPAPMVTAATKDDVPPVITDARATPPCVSRGQDLKFAYNLSENASVLYSVRRVGGARLYSRCPTKFRPRPYDSAPSDQDVRGEHGGHRSVVLGKASRLARMAGLTKHLKPGTYLLVIRATDAAGNRSKDALVKFWVLRH